MKKLSILFLGVLGLMAVSCDDSIEPATPQQNPQEPILTEGDIVSSKAGVLASDAVLDLQQYAEVPLVEVMKLDEAKNLPAGASVFYRMQLSDTDTFTKSVTLDAEAGENEDNSNLYYVNAEDWSAAHVYLFGKDPKAMTAYYRILTFVELDGSDYRYQGVDVYAAQGTIQEKRMNNLGYFVDAPYYLVGGATTWELTEAALAGAKFSHNDEYSVWDDPRFEITFDVTDAALIAGNGVCEWMIAPQGAIGSTGRAKLVGPASDPTAMEGALVPENAIAGQLTKAATYKLSINMQDMSYEIKEMQLPEYLYTPGNTNGWSQTASAWLQQKTNDTGFEYYYGVSPLEGGFKICAKPAWDNATDYGALTEDPANSGKLLVGGGAKNITPEAAGLYWIKVNADVKTKVLLDYTLIPLKRVGLIGSFAASGWGSDVAMTTADGGKTWTASIDFGAGTEFKVRFNEDWGYNLGGEYDHLTFDAGNLKVEEAGTYTVTLELMGGVPRIKMAKK